MFRINICHIIKDHFKSLRLEGSEEMYWGDKVIFFVFPMIVTFFLFYHNVDLKPQVGNLIKAMAIFAAFMFNLLAVIHGQLGEIKENTKKINNQEDRKRKIKFAEEIHSNITFNIILAVALIFFLLIYDLTPCIGNLTNVVIIKVTLMINYFLLFLFLLTLMMVINRVYILVRHENEVN